MQVWITNQKKTNLAEGAKFKRGEIVAKNEQYFHGAKDDVSYVTGKLVKVALTGGDFTYEDSSVVTEDLSDAMSSEITVMKRVSLGKNANVEFIAKKGEDIISGDPLLVFEGAYDEKTANELLERLGEDFGEAISEMGKNQIKSKYTGIVADVKIYYNRPIEEYSESLQKIIKSYIAGVERRRKIVRQATGSSTADPTGILFSPTSRVDSDKINGEDVDGVLIEFYVKYLDKMKTGDKIAFGTALKSVIADVIKAGEEPLSEVALNDGEYVQAIISPCSVVSRMTTDFFSMLWLNKVLLWLKRRFEEAYRGEGQ